MAANLNVALKHLAAANVPLPAKVQTLVDARHAVMTATSSSGEHGRLVADIQAGNLDVATVADRLRAAAAERVTGTAHSAIVKDLAGRLEQQILHELRSSESHTHVVEALRPLFAEVVQAHQDALDEGIQPDMSAEDLTRLGSAAIIANARLKDADDKYQAIEMARKTTSSQYMEAEHLLALSSVLPSRKTGGFDHEWESCLEYTRGITGMLQAGQTPRLNTDAEAAVVTRAADIPPARKPSAADLADAQRTAAVDRADDRRAGGSIADRAAKRKADRKAA